MDRWRLGLAAGCLSAYGALALRYAGPPSRLERAVFDSINDGGQHAWLRVPQQWGTPWTLPVVAGFATLGGRRDDAVAALLCLPMTKGIEVATKKLRPRPRPIYTQPTELRDDAPVEGGSMPSGHAALAACGTVLLLPHVSPRARIGLASLTGVSATVRIHQGAHEPTDALAGLLLGAGVAIAVTELVRAVWPAGR